MLIKKDFHITLGDLSVCYTDSGNTSHPVLIFINDFLLGQAMWHTQKDTLEGNFRVITYDIRGFGKSEAGTRALTIDLFVNDLTKLMDALKIQKAILCGFAMGGHIALRAMERHHHRFSGLILYATQCMADSQAQQERHIIDIGIIQRLGLACYVDFVLPKFLSRDSFRSKSHLIEELRSMMVVHSPDIVCDSILAVSKRSETCNDLKRIDVPVLILVGSEDTLTPMYMAEVMQRRIRGSALQVISGSAHLCHADKPEEFNHYLGDFLHKIAQPLAK